MAAEAIMTELTLKKRDRDFLYNRLVYMTQSSDTSTGKFLYRTKAHFIVAFIVGCERDGIDFETIFRKYNKQISLISRSTVQSILKSGVMENFFVKIENPNDHRRKNYFLSKSAIRNFEIDIKNLRDHISM